MLVLSIVVISAPAHVVECHDGDTCTFNIHLGLGVVKIERVRICDIDAPELRDGEIALNSKHTMFMLLKTADILEIVPSRSIYNPKRSFARLLAWVKIDGTDVGMLLVSRGLAKVSIKRCKENIDE